MRSILRREQVGQRLVMDAFGVRTIISSIMSSSQKTNKAAVVLQDRIYMQTTTSTHKLQSKTRKTTRARRKEEEEEGKKNNIKQEGIIQTGKVPDRKCYVSTSYPIWNTVQKSPNPNGKYLIPDAENRNDPFLVFGLCNRVCFLYIEEIQTDKATRETAKETYILWPSPL